MAPSRPSVLRQMATTWSIKEYFPSSLGYLHSATGPPRDGQTLTLQTKICLNTPHVSTCCGTSDSSTGRSLSGRWTVICFPSDEFIRTRHSMFLGASYLHTSSLPRHRIPTPGTSDVVPLRPLAEFLVDWVNLPNPSRWLLRTIRLGYAIQFARRPPKFSGILFTSVQGENAVVL